jgi:hypothetical protein
VAACLCTAPQRPPSEPLSKVAETLPHVLLQGVATPILDRTLNWTTGFPLLRCESVVPTLSRLPLKPLGEGWG